MTVSSPDLPTRLVKIEGHADDLRARLVVTDESMKDGQYAALSYRWSKKKGHITLADYVQAYTNDIPLGTLPATIRDCIRVTHALGIRYVWVDCLCIIQDSSRDWELECGKMANIYANATITLAASSGIDAEYGLLRSRNVSPESNHCNLTFRDASSLPCGEVKVAYIENMRTLNLGPVNEAFQSSPLDQRGWTLQERLLSTRVLSFEDDRTWWECTSCRMVEALHPCILASTNSLYDPVIAKEPLSTLTSAQIYGWWLMALQDFCGRQLSYAEDLLPAIAGLASVVSRVTNDTYLAGLWQRDLARGLMWSSGGSHSELHVPDLSAPSWSWARSEKKVSHKTYELFHVESCVDFVSANIKTAGANPFGRVMPGSALTIRASTRPALIHWEENGDLVVFSVPTTHPGLDVRCVIDSPITQRTNVAGKQVSVLVVKIAILRWKTRTGKLKAMSTSGLLLQLTDDGNTYQRIGIIWVEALNDSNDYSEAQRKCVEHFYKDAETKTISMI